LAFYGHFLHEPGTFLSLKLSDINILVAEALSYCADGEQIPKFAASNTWKARFDDAGLLP